MDLENNTIVGSDNNIKILNKIFLITSIILALNIILIVGISILIFDIFPKKLFYFENKLNDLNKFESRVNIMEDKFNEIYSIVMNFCEILFIKNICYKKKIE